MSTKAPAGQQVMDDDIDDIEVLEGVEDEDDLEGLDRGDSLEGEEAAEGEEAEEAEEPAEEEPAEEEAVEEAAEEEPEPEPKPEPTGKKDQRIPKERFDDVNERRKAAERRALELEARLAAQQAPSDFDFEAKETAYMTAVLDGNTEQVLALRSEIRAAENAMYQAQAQASVAQATTATKAELAFDNAVSELNKTYPVFDPDADGYDAGLVEEAIEYHELFLAKHSPAEALKRAVKYVATMHGLQPAGAEAAEEPAPPPKPGVKKPDMKAKLAAAAAQPARQAGKSTAKEKAVDITSMSEEEFEALPEATLRRMRGDI